MAEGVKCGNCGGPVKGPPGAMACPYCGFRVDIPITAAERQNDDRELRELEQIEREERERARRHDSYEEDDEPSSRPSSSSSSSSSPVIIGIVVAVLAVVFIGAIAASKSRSKKWSKDDRKSSSVTAAATTTAKKSSAIPQPPAYFDPVSIPSCRCSFGDGQSTPLVTLTLKAANMQDPTQPLALGISRQSGFVTETSSAQLVISSPTALSPGDGGAIARHLGVACDTGVYVLVGDRTATGWSSVNGGWKWTAALPAAMTDDPSAITPPQPKNTSFSSYCTALPTQNGNATITLASGRRATLSIKDGKLR